jgi:hypothetical protein
MTEKNDPSTYVDETELALFYQVLSTAPQLGMVLFRPELADAFRAWLNDIHADAPIREQRWLEALYLYYGMYEGEPLEYREVGERLGKSLSTVRDRAARGLRYLWEVTHVRDGEKQELYEEALRVNEWPTADLSQEVSLGFFEVLMDEAGAFLDRATPRVDEVDDGKPHRVNLHPQDQREPNLWNPEYAEKLWPELTAPDRVLMKGGVPA